MIGMGVMFSHAVWRVLPSSEQQGAKGIFGHLSTQVGQWGGGGLGQALRAGLA